MVLENIRGACHSNVRREIKMRLGSKAQTKGGECMKSQAAILAGLCLFCSVTAFGQVTSPAAQAPKSETGMYVPDTVAPNIPGVVAGGTKVHLVKDDYTGPAMISYEGPVPLPDGSILFVENMKGLVHKLDNEGNSSIFLENTNEALGMAFDSKGRLIVVETKPGKSRIAVIYPKGSETVLSDNFEGKPYGRANDLVVDKKNGVYFTDPGPHAQPGSPPPSVPPAVYYLPAGGKAIKVVEGVPGPNGIQLSPDEKILYLNNTSDYLLAFDVQADGTLSNRRNFAKYDGAGPGVNLTADGLAVDSEGRIYVATRMGVQVYSAKGEYLGTIPTSRQPQNLAFGGPDKKFLYVVGFGAVFKIQMLAQGIKTRAK
jgi:gluconolactonase